MPNPYPCDFAGKSLVKQGTGEIFSKSEQINNGIK
jgi:hypothetical protein